MPLIKQTCYGFVESSIILLNDNGTSYRPKHDYTEVVAKKSRSLLFFKITPKLKLLFK
jgi:hypothetical protein